MWKGVEMGESETINLRICLADCRRGFGEKNEWRMIF